MESAFKGRDRVQCYLSNRLQISKFLVNAAKGDEVIVLAALDDLAFLQDHDFVGILDGGQAVRDDDGGALAHHFGQGILHKSLAFSV